MTPIERARQVLDHHARCPDPTVHQHVFDAVIALNPDWADFDDYMEGIFGAGFRWADLATRNRRSRGEAW